MYKILLFGYLLFVQILPVTQDGVQLALLVIVFFLALLQHYNKTTAISQKIFSSTSKKYLALKVLFINSIIFTLFGFVTNQPGAFDYLLLDIILPLVFLTIFFAGDRDNVTKIINYSFIVATFIIGILFLLQILNFGGASDFLITLGSSDEDQRVAQQDGKVTGLRFIPLYSLSYLAPISLHNLSQSINKLLSRAGFTSTKNIWIEILLVIISFFNFTTAVLCIFLSGRQGLILGFFASLALLIALQFFMSSFSKTENKQQLKHVTGVVIVVLILPLMILLVNNLVEFIKIDYEYFQSFLAKNESDFERIGQFQSLVNGWYTSPLFGHGNGSTVSWIRDEERPWRYELGYLLRLNNTGLAGFSIYSFGIFLIFVSLIKKFYVTGKILYISALAGLISLLIADGTNPYMIRFTVSYYLYYCLWLSITNDSSKILTSKSEETT